MSQLNLQKTHYEQVTQYLSTRVNSYYKDLMDHGNKACGQDPTYETFFRAFYPPFPLSTEQEKAFVYEANVMYHLYHMKTSGDKIYYITPSLAAKLANTNLNVDVYFLKSPFREVFIQIDPGLFSLYDLDKTVHPVLGFYFHYREVGDSKEIRVMVVSVLHPTPDIPFNDSTYYFRFVLGPGKIHDQVRDYIAKQKVEQADMIQRHGGSLNIDFIEDFMMFACNSMLYITSKDPDLLKMMPVDYACRMGNLKSNRKIQKLQKRADKSSSYITIVAGSHMNDNREDVECLSRAGSVGAWKLMKKVKVSGHWRVQWHGSSKDNTKESAVIWISDYTKGPDAAELMKTLHVVK